MPAASGLSSDPIETSPALYTALVIITALAWYNLFELNFLIFVTFKRYSGLYFWSLMVASWGTCIQALGFLLKFFPTGAPIYLCLTLITIGWYSMVTGHSVVLYSRLNLVVKDPQVLKRVLTMIICDALLFHPPTTVLTFGSNATGLPASTVATFNFAYSIMEKIQMTAFSIQEMIIAGIYVHATWKLFEPRGPKSLPKPVIELILVNCFIIVMNVTLLGVEYASMYDVEVMMKSLIYTIKLKLEFAVLSDLKNYKAPTNRKVSTAPEEKQRRPSRLPFRSDKSGVASPAATRWGSFMSRKGSESTSPTGGLFRVASPMSGFTGYNGPSDMKPIQEDTLFNEHWGFESPDHVVVHAHELPERSHTNASRVPPSFRKEDRSNSLSQNPLADFVEESDSEAEFGAYEHHEDDD